MYDRIRNGAVYLYQSPRRDAEPGAEPFLAKVLAGPFTLPGGLQVQVIDRLLVPPGLDGGLVRSRPHPRAVVAAFDERAALAKALATAVGEARRSGDSHRLKAVLTLVLDGAGTVIRGGDTRPRLQEALADPGNGEALSVVAESVEQDLKGWLERERMAHAPRTTGLPHVEP